MTHEYYMEHREERLAKRREYSEEELRAAMEKWAPQIIAAHSADWYASQVDEREA